MITREEIRQLAQLESPSGCAISFYFQPKTPRDKSHREEAIVVKDLVRDALREAERNGNKKGLRDDLNRILEQAENLHGNHSRGKAIFACSEHGIWKEMDVPARLVESAVIVNSRFHLKPLIAACSGLPKTCIALVDRQKARIFELQEELTQKPDLLLGALPHVGKSDGFGGYDGGHRERHVENEVMQHFKMFAESLQMLMNHKYEALLIGCHDESWPELEPHLHTYVKQRLLGRFRIDPGVATLEEVRTLAEEMIGRHTRREQEHLIREMIGEAQRNARGALGLRHVVSALERQEVQTLLVSRDFQAQAVECGNCRHLDTRMVRTCAVCNHETHEIGDVSDALVDMALRNGAEIIFVDNNAELESAGRVGALLRFRADQNTPQKIAV
jgi:peptide chain release factor subunit 1